MTGGSQKRASLPVRAIGGALVVQRFLLHPSTPSDYKVTSQYPHWLDHFVIFSKIPFSTASSTLKIQEGRYETFTE